MLYTNCGVQPFRLIAMAVRLTQEEEKVVQQFLDAVKYENVRNHRKVTSWAAAVKFLMARKFDLKRAYELYKAHEVTREQEDLLFIDPDDRQLQEEINTEKFTVLPGRDVSGASIALFTARLHHPSQTTHQTVLKGLVYQLDAALESYDTQRNGLVFVYDMTDSKYANFDYDLSVKILSLLRGAYPARLKRVLIVTAPLWFKAPFKILRLFIKQKLRERVFTVNLQELGRFIPTQLLPKTLGGCQVVVHSAWLRICRQVASGMQPNMDSYFKAAPVNDSQGSGNQSNSGHADPHVYDDSETSKSNVSEKHTDEGEEKEKDDGDTVTSKKKDTEDGIVSRKRKTSSSRLKQSSELVSCDHSNEDLEFNDLPRKKRPLSSGSNILNDSIHMPDSEGLSISQLIEHLQTVKKRGLLSEYATIHMESHAGTFNISRARHNLPKNRYTDVLCYDQSRVKLPLTDGDPSTDYINANFVDGYMQKNAYISTQGPLPKTFVDFWRMVWQNQCQVIVMTTKVIERQRMKCGQYWPDEEQTDEQLQEFVVFNKSIRTLQHFVETKLVLHNTNTGQSRDITHLHFISWPDYGVPPAASFLTFLFHVRSVQETSVKNLGSSWTGHPLGPPIVVHCSAGIGRTGTFITIDISLRRLEDIGTVNVPATVRRIRSQRAFSIQMPCQYVFCHMGIVEHALQNGMVKDIDKFVLADSDNENESE